ncbi:MAG TPA: AmmeMemoRadiSam system radical SAM enzyme [Anaeromyxobacter sp.]|nr:AmmeMemoRadiSam system radical SAM enzyme [Anaeromyxobacter sp.]
MVREARYFEELGGGRVRCTLCPRDCRLRDGQAGFCFVRENRGGQLVTTAWGRSTGFAVDPIEKKPLAHYLPGSTVLSFGTAGCNLGCRFCQNWEMSKARLSDQRAEDDWTPERVVDLARQEGTPGIAFTYNDPVIWAEYAIDVARAAHQAGLYTAFVTAGYVTPEARAEIFPHMDAANVDLKGFTEGFYSKLTLAHLAPVLDTLEWLAREARTWVEVTNLVIPGWNDDPAETRALSRWLVDHMGPDVPLHLTAFHPDFRMRDVPPTPPATLRRARELALSEGLHHVYTGNVHDPAGQTTYCPSCGEAVIERDWHAVRRVRLRGSACAGCGTRIAGRFEGEAVGPGDGRRRRLGPPRA